MKKLNCSLKLTLAPIFFAVCSSFLSLSAMGADLVVTPYISYDENGHLVRPKNYREWVYVGTGATPKSLDESVFFPDFQNVYIDPVSYRHWKKYGEFPENTILVKELMYVGKTDSPVGKGFFQGDYRSVSAAVRSKAQFPETFKNWNYFGWVNQETKKLNRTAAPRGDQCAACHKANAAEGTVFYTFFPVLRDSKGYGDDAPENADTRKGLH